MQLGELRRNREAQLVTATLLTAEQHMAEVTWHERHKAEKDRKMETVRKSIQTHRSEVALEIGKKMNERESELELIRNKQKQLRDIKRMLNEPFTGLTDPGAVLEPSPSQDLAAAQRRANDLGTYGAAPAGT